MLHVEYTNGEGNEDIFVAMERGDTEQCARLISLDRTLLARKGWGGYTPLHYAAFQGNRPLADLLLSHGADTNVPCDGGQTPFHFTCRQGNVHLMHQMLQHGADLRITDLQGKTALHYSVSGGNIIAVQYLAETEMFRFSDTDKFLVTPLHLAASMGHTDMTKYLLRNNRCHADAADHQGATALHVAAERGAMEVSWLLVQEAGVHLLHLRNHRGLTSVDLCRKGNTFRHQQLTKLLSKFIADPTHLEFKESRGMYYCTLLFPSLCGAVILSLAEALGGYGALLCILLFPWLAKCVFSQYHRMNSYQRLPNPVYLGTLAAGIFHSLVCFFGKIVPSLWPSNALFHVSVIHFSVTLWLFWRVLARDPGQLLPGNADPRFSSIVDLVEDNQNLSRFCVYCEMFQPDNCKHCKLCDVCVLEYDHHCLFLNRCVGRNNHRLFILFILAMEGAHLIFVLWAACYLYWKLTEPLWPTWAAALGREAWVLVLTTMNILTLVWEGWLLREQFDAISMGTTTYFRNYTCPRHPRWRRWGTVFSFLIEDKRIGQREVRSPIDV